MRTLWMVLFLLGPAIFSNSAAAPQTAQPADRAIVLHAMRVLNVEAGTVELDAVVIVRDGKITDVGPASKIKIPKGAQVIDLGDDTTLLPGLIDAHVHLAWGPPQDGAMPGVSEALATLRAGFTTVRNLGSTGRADLALRDAISAGKIPGPRIIAAGTPLGAKGGVCDQVFRGEGQANGAEAITAKVREVLAAGIDVVKLCAGGGVMPGAADATAIEYSEEEIRAIVAEAHQRGKKVAAHAQGPAAILNAVRAGVDSIEHGAGINEEAARLMRGKKVSLVATLYRLDFALENAEKRGAPPANLDCLRAARAAAHDNVRRAIALGVPIAVGTDATVIPHGLNARELAVLVKLGMSPAGAIRAATIGNAALLGLAAQIGSIARGKSADLITVEGNPLQDITALERIRFVMKDGKVIRNDPRVQP